ncbi:MAG TPA: hypothetical protein VGM88_00470 [Kofleriaceae bacterium]|jgi:hypothetical protein
MRLVGGLVIAWAGVATAQPAEVPLPSGHCSVTVAEAPAPVAGTIEHWAEGELHCKTTLVVRVFPVANGLMIVATDASGGVRQRVVPDADSAGVLVASWIADDAPPAIAPPPTVALVAPEVPANAMIVHEPSREQAAPALGVELLLQSGVLTGYGFRVTDGQALSARAWGELGRRDHWRLELAAQLDQPIDTTNDFRRGSLWIGGAHGAGRGSVYVREDAAAGFALAFGHEASDFGQTNYAISTHADFTMHLGLAGGVRVADRVALELSLVTQMFLGDASSWSLGLGLGVRVGR